MQDHPPIHVQLDGALTIQRADSIREQLLAALSQGAPVVVDVSQATDMDVSFLQILVSARQTLEGGPGSFAVEAGQSGVLAAALARCGLAPDAAGLAA